MATTLTPKENWLRLGRGEMPDYVPCYTMGGAWPPSGTKTLRDPTRGAMLPIFFRRPEPGASGPPASFTNMWGVPFVTNAETNFAGLPEPDNFILDDITKWDTIVKRPEIAMDPDEYDWEALAKAALEPIDREQQAVSFGMGDGPFGFITSLMGFTEGLIALVEEPEICCEMFDWLQKFYEPYRKRAIEAIKPDIYSMGDDNASKYAPFVSLETFRKTLLPTYMNYGAEARDRNLPVHFHDCGKCEIYMDDYFEVGVRYWDPAQVTNDLLAVKAKFNNRLVIVGGFDFVPDINYNQVSEEYVREFTRGVIDKLAPGGAYAFLGGYLGRSDEMDIAAQINTWITTEVDTYGFEFYNK
ncbi:MAG: hypothetical protein FWG30_08755 [Eubacteriaceae bacterium]|jgi:hypothetical protein|nr:hypothetical protein [Eubacteriaceae bacterium]